MVVISLPIAAEAKVGPGVLHRIVRAPHGSVAPPGVIHTARVLAVGAVVSGRVVRHDPWMDVPARDEGAPAARIGHKAVSGDACEESCEH